MLRPIFRGNARCTQESALPSQESEVSRTHAHARPWPNPTDSLDDLPVSLRRHFEIAEQLYNGPLFFNLTSFFKPRTARAHCLQLRLSDCMSFVNHLNSYFLAKTQDKRLEIKMRSMRQSLRDEDENVETLEKFPDGGDKLLWIHTSTMVADCRTKRMKPDLLLQILHTNRYCVELTRKEKKTQAEFNVSQLRTCKVGCV